MADSVFRFSHSILLELTLMSKSKDIKKDKKKAPLKTAKEKKKAKLEKRNK